MATALAPLPKVTTTTTQTVALAPTLRRRLLVELKAYEGLKAQLGIIQHALDGHKTRIGAIQQETGEVSIALEGFKVTHVTGTRTVLDKAKLVELGCAMAWIEEATSVKPNKPFTKITVPGGRDDD